MCKIECEPEASYVRNMVSGMQRVLVDDLSLNMKLSVQVVQRFQ